MGIAAGGLYGYARDRLSTTRLRGLIHTLCQRRRAKGRTAD